MNNPLYKLGDFNAIQVMRSDQTASGYGTLEPRGRGINGGWSTSLVRVRRSARPLLEKKARLDGILQPKGRSTGGPRRLRMDEGSITWSPVVRQLFWSLRDSSPYFALSPQHRRFANSLKAPRERAPTTTSSRPTTVLKGDFASRYHLHIVFVIFHRNGIFFFSRCIKTNFDDETQKIKLIVNGMNNINQRRIYLGATAKLLRQLGRSSWPDNNKKIFAFVFCFLFFDYYFMLNASYLFVFFVSFSCE